MSSIIFFDKNFINHEHLKLIPVNISAGEVPIYIEALWNNREYYVNADTEIKDALDTTVNLPRYIQGDLNGLKGSSSENTLFAFASGERTMPLDA